MAESLKLKQKCSHMRAKLKAFGVKARVRMMDGAIQVITPTFEYSWSHSELLEIAKCAIANRMTFVQGMEIDPSIVKQLTGRNQFDFFLNDED